MTQSSAGSVRRDAGAGGEFALLLLGAEGGGVERDFVEDAGDDGDVIGVGDLAAVAGAEPGVVVVHDLLESPQRDDGVVEVGADEFVGDVGPEAEFDFLAVEQHEPGLGGQGGVGCEGVEQAGFAATGFACGQEVPVDGASVDGPPVFTRSCVLEARGPAGVGASTGPARVLDVGVCLDGCAVVGEAHRYEPAALANGLAELDLRAEHDGPLDKRVVAG